VAFVGDLRLLLRRRDFARLYATRLTSQTADGVFQAALAAAVFFNPTRQADAGQVAAGFVVLLLPYSLVGPFAGIFLDRWRRRQVLVYANLVRTAFVVGTAALLVTRGPTGPGFYVVALVALSVNRFYLSALSAALPHVVEPGELVLANSVSNTSGSLVTVVGGGIGLGVRQLAGTGDAGSAVIALVAAAVYVASSATAARMPVDLLGPQPRAATLAVRTAMLKVVRDFAAALGHLSRRPRAGSALLAIGSHRFFYGLSTLATLLLYRNFFADRGLLRAGLAGLAEVVAASIVGYVVAAVVTPVATRRIAKESWIVAVFVLAAVAEAGATAAFGFPALTQGVILAAAFLLGIAAQGSKICVDTIVQETVADDFRGRVFALYDTLFNLTFVLAAVAGAFLLPPTGRSLQTYDAIAAGYAATALVYGAAAHRRRARLSPEQRAAELVPAGR
jgi:MFS family permease